MSYLHYNKKSINSKCNWVMDSISKGWNTDNYHFWGFIQNNQQIIKNLINDKIDWYFWDMPYYGRWLPNSNKTFYWRVSKNHIHYQFTKNFPSDRFKQWNIEPKPYKPGSKILICPSSETVTRWITGKTVQQWIDDTKKQLELYTDRPIEVRYKPRANGTSGPAAAKIPFETQANDAYCVVTCVSIAAVEAQLMGIPTLCDPTSFAAEISSTRLQDIESLKMTNTEQWFYNLAYSQFTHDEIESGLAKEIVG